MNGQRSFGEIGRAQPARDARELGRLAALWPWEMQGARREDRLRLLSRLRMALRQERRRGQAGHWSYDLARHAQLVTAYRTELSRFMAEFGGVQPPCGVVEERRGERR